MTNFFKFILLQVGFSMFFGNAVVASSLSDIIEEALRTNVKISAARNNLIYQSEGINQLIALKKPNVSANILGDRDWDLRNDDESASFSAAVTARYRLFDGNHTNHKIEAEDLRIKTMKAEFEGITQAIIFEAIIAYLNVLKDKKLVKLSYKNVNVLAQQLDATTSRFQLGELTKTDVAQAKAALEAATSILASREGVLYLANKTFETAVGMKPTDLDENITLPDLPKSESEAKMLAAKFNTNLKASTLREKRAEILLEAAKSKSWPTLNFSTSLSAGERASEQQFSNFGFSFSGSIPLYSGGSLESAERQAFVDLELSMVNAEITRLTVEQAVVTAWSDYQVSSALIRARTREVEATHLAYRGTLEETRLGARTTLDVLNAEQNLMNAQTNLETAKRNRLAAGYRVLLETGTLTPSSLGVDGLSK